MDAITCCGYKWLCGPYATGFCWLTPALRNSLITHHAYWLAMPAGKPLDKMRDYAPRTDLGARAWDIFCTANFFNFVPWTAASPPARSEKKQAPPTADLDPSETTREGPPLDSAGHYARPDVFDFKVKP